MDTDESIKQVITKELDSNDEKQSVRGSGNPLDDKVVWSPDNEKILIEWCDVAQCYKWLNFRSHTKLATQQAWFTIPAIILSTITGTASFAQETFPPNIKQYAPAIIGSINILVGILTTIQQYLKVSEKNEAHRVSAISWDKFARNVRIELAKKPEERDKAGHFIKACRMEFDRLMETSPSIENSTVKEFKHKFKNKPGFDKVKKPDICDTITSAEETRNQWYKQIGNEPIIDSAAEEAVKERDNFILEQQRILAERNDELIRHDDIKREQENLKLQEIQDTARKLREEEDEYNLHVEKIIQYINGYEEVYARKPLKEDIINNFETTIDVIVLDKFLSGYMK
jgi:hypothetical protein